MKIPLLVSTGILLVALLPCQECRALSKSPVAAHGALQQPDFFQQQQEPQQQQQPEEAEGEAVEREKRSEEPPISLDLTFHLLREVLEMARAEQLAQQAHSNRKLMEIIGK
ncbi:PREDICTED: corticoliberin [Mesitornis unicolor]|uniref:corticoliberin n=1 Tax=Mesitornis unicolor TaxID=54374 RepID=UPI0005289CCA|nr:PREDICTED: corticoliberin [Mesitornis unicolor]